MYMMLRARKNTRLHRVVTIGKTTDMIKSAMKPQGHFIFGLTYSLEWGRTLTLRPFLLILMATSNPLQIWSRTWNGTDLLTGRYTTWSMRYRASWG